MIIRKLIYLYTFFEIFCSLAVAEEIDFIPFEKLEKYKLFFSIEESIENPTNVLRLCQGGQNFDHIPSQIGILTELRYFNAAQNNIKEFPVEFCKLNKLQEINMAGNDLETIPDCIFNLQNLKILDLSSNKKLQWEEILQKINIMDSLEELDISGNGIQKFPREIKMNGLKKLIITDNNLSDDELIRIEKRFTSILIIK